MKSIAGFDCHAEAREAADDIPQNTRVTETIGDVINARYGRRDVMRGMLGAAAIAGLEPLVGFAPDARADTGFSFPELASGVDETHHVAEGYDTQVLLRWGDPVFADSPAFDPLNQSAGAQLRQFGYNNDFVGFIPLRDDGARGLLCVNHEYTNEEVMFPGIARQDKRIGGKDEADAFADMTNALCDIEMAAHGATIIELRRTGNRWTPETGSPYNRRISALETTMAIDGPAAGHARMKTGDDPTGERVIGTINNCAGGITAWGTYLMAEENFRFYFWADKRWKMSERCAPKETKSARRYGIGQTGYAWGKFHDRFNLAKEPNEPNRFGWIVEVDPLDPGSMPVKHTALGRFCHEGAESIVNKDGRVVLYSGDDTRFEYVYRFVSAGRFNPDDRAANMDLLSNGTLSVARFHKDGTVQWLPLVQGTGPLTPEGGFETQADVLIDTRLAADALGATCMDRPEDIQPNPVTNAVYVMLTNNHKRKTADASGANPRAKNMFGHIIEMLPPGGDHTAEVFRWAVLVRCGDKDNAKVDAKWHPETSRHGWFASPDNCAIDAQGRLWVATDQGGGWPRTGKSDGLYALETEGRTRGKSTLFFRCPIGAELCGPTFTPDQETLFLAVQHPGTDGTRAYKPFGRKSSFEDPATRWPDFRPGMPPRPSVVAVTRKGGGPIG